NAKSPIRFIIIALIAALLAWIRVNQKLINKYEQSPTPSHPTNICNKLFAVTKINIKNVNNDKYDINRGKCGSCDIYSIEYRCTNVEIEQTTTNITTVKESNKKPNDTLNSSEFTHEYDIIDIVSPCI